MTTARDAATSRGKGRTRRQFLHRAATGTALVAMAPRGVLVGAVSSPPSEKLDIAGVGIGGMGAGNMSALGSENVVALCDVDEQYGGRTFRRFPKATRYSDYRVMLEKEKGIEAVMVATPDHMHAPISMAAIRLGKHVYCEKPLTATVYEARELAKAAREHNVATQMGNRGQAEEGVRLLCEWIWADAIGPVREVHVWTDRPRRGIYDEYWPQGVDRPSDQPTPPDILKWDLWLGVAPERPFHPAYHPFRWRGWWDFGTGALGDIGCHALDGVFRALKLGAPESVEACSSPVNNETYPVSSVVTWRFPERREMPAVRVSWYDGGLRPPRPVELEEGEQLGSYTNGLLFVGEEGKLMTAGSGRPPVLIPTERNKSYEAPPKTLPRSPGHYKEWVDAAKGGEPAGSNFDHAGPLTEAVLLGNIALRRSMRDKLAAKRLLWDAASLKFPNAPEADEYIHREYRKGWTL